MGPPLGAFCQITLTSCLLFYLAILASAPTRSVAAGFGRHGMPPPASNDTGTALGQDGSDSSRDFATLTFSLEVMAPLADAGRQSSSIRVSSLKFAGLVVRKIWRTMCVSINGPGDLDL